MIFPKQQRKRKRKKHKQSILQDRTEGTCYLCVRLHNNYQLHRYREEHHVFGGQNRGISEAEGLKVYLCLDHHRNGSEAVHNNHENMLLLQQDAQRIYEEKHTRQQFIEMIGRN